MHIRLVEAHHDGLRIEASEVRLTGVRRDGRDHEVVAGEVADVAFDEGLGVEGGARLGDRESSERLVFAEEDGGDGALGGAANTAQAINIGDDHGRGGEASREHRRCGIAGDEDDRRPLDRRYG